MKTKEKLQWVLIIAAGVVIGNLLLTLMFYGFNALMQNRENRICDGIINISGSSDISECTVICNGQCSVLGYNGGQAIYKPLNFSDLAPVGCECLCKGCISP